MYGGVKLEDMYVRYYYEIYLKLSTADQVIATGGDITNLKEFAIVIPGRCPGINVDVIEVT